MRGTMELEKRVHLLQRYKFNSFIGAVGFVMNDASKIL